MPKKDFTKSVTNAADKFFSKPVIEEIPAINIELENANINNDDKQFNDTKHTHITNIKNKSKHYDERGKREERYGLLLDRRLKEDLKSLANASGSRSINDFIVTILLDYVEIPKNQEILKAYNELQKLR